MSDQSLIERIAQTIQVHASAKQVYGDPVERDGLTVIPVARVQWGFGGGALGRGAIERGGGGGGARAHPSGFIEIRDGKAEFRPIHDAGTTAGLVSAAALGLITGLVLAKLLRH